MGVAMTLTGHEKDLGGGFKVLRLLPSAKRQAVGPFLFFDHFGPVSIRPEDNFDVRPHPHIGLATVTFLFEGAIEHKDSLGSQQEIHPGAINWMTAGRGIVHSERRPAWLREKMHVNHGIQLWAGLPEEHEETAPAFVHTPAEAVPQVRIDDADIGVLVGEAFGTMSPVAVLSPTLYLDVRFSKPGTLKLPPVADELAIYPVDHDIDVDGVPLPARTLAVLTPRQTAVIRTASEARIIAIGGEVLSGHRHMWWNFVSSRKERIDQAADDWRAQRMGSIASDPEFIPLPERT
jgi:redox-sensitive bicupin YhaK (pirin superfamily)